MSTRLLGIALIVVSAITWWGTLDIPPSRYDVLGSAAFPRALAVLIALFAVALLWRGDEAPATTPAPGDGASGPDEDAERPTPYMALATAAASVVYVFLLQLRIVNFGVLTAGFLIVIITVLTRFNPRALPLTLAVAVLMGAGIDYVFTSIFIVDLP